MRKLRNSGFTLIEVLVVIGIIAILASIVVVAINPARQFSQANNSQRWSNVNAVLNAVHQYMVDNRGALPAGLSTTTNPLICKSGATAATCATNEGISLETLIPTYVVAMPTDPLASSTANVTGYRITLTDGNRVVVSAPSAENGEVISVTR